METIKRSSFDNMIIGNCVSCGGLVRIPLNADPEATVRCPRCGEDFRLGAVLEDIAPVLEVIDTAPAKPQIRTPRVFEIVDDGPDQPSDRQRGDKFEVSPILQKGAKKKKKKRRRRSSSSGPSVSNGTGQSELAGSPESTVPVATIDEQNSIENKSRASADVESTRPRRSQPRKAKKSASKQQSSSGLEITKVILGACLALPVAQLLIWWFAGTDPLNLGPKVSQFAPFIVPSEFQETEMDELFGDSETDAVE